MNSVVVSGEMADKLIPVVKADEEAEEDLVDPQTQLRVPILYISFSSSHLLNKVYLGFQTNLKVRISEDPILPMLPVHNIEKNLNLF